MIRNLKALLAAALTVSALSALAASASQAATPATFTAPGAGAAEATTLQVLKDGTGKTAHQVIDWKEPSGGGFLSITCNELAGGGTMYGPSSEDITIQTPQLQSSCVFAGQAMVIENTGCNFTLTPSSPQLHIVSEPGKECLHGKQSIHYTNTMINCKIEIAEQTISGLKYHNLEDGTITVETPGLTVQFNALGAGCPYGTSNNSEWTTGNYILTGERGGKMVTVEWDPQK
jgi:hypothetical protein